MDFDYNRHIIGGHSESETFSFPTVNNDNVADKTGKVRGMAATLLPQLKCSDLLKPKVTIVVYVFLELSMYS